MRNNIIITLIIIVAVFVTLVAFLKPEWISKTWVWIIGLGGSATVIIKKFFGAFNSNSSANEIDSSNDELKQKLQELELKINDTNERMQLERALYKKDVELLESRIALREKEILLEQEKRKRLEQIPWEEYLEDMTPEQKEALKRTMDSNTSSFIN